MSFELFHEVETIKELTKENGELKKKLEEAESRIQEFTKGLPQLKDDIHKFQARWQEESEIIKEARSDVLEELERWLDNYRDPEFIDKQDMKEKLRSMREVP